MRFITAVLGVIAACAAAGDSANYDTTWSYVYPGGTTKAGKPTLDAFRDAKTLASGEILCVGETQDSADLRAILAVRLYSDGKPNRTKFYSFEGGAMGASLAIGKSGGPIIGGNRYNAPLLLRLDTALEAVSATWHYDSIAGKDRLSKGATLNSLLELEDGSVVAAAGDLFPDNNGAALNNFAAYMEFEASGQYKRSNQWLNSTGYEIAGWSIARGQTFGYLIGGKQAAFLLDNTGVLLSQTKYTFSLPGVGTVTNNVSRIGTLPGGKLVAVGQAYEEDGWTRYQRLSFDAWWSPLGTGGGDDARHVAGVSGSHDYLYDFAPLADGRIAFLGAKGTDPDSGLWAFVTDSTAKTVLWQRQYNLPGRDNGSARRNLLPLRIVALPDSGFLLAGIETASGNNDNAFVFRLKGMTDPVSTLKPPSHRLSRAKGGWNLSFKAEAGTALELSLFDISGRLEWRCRGSLTPDGRVAFVIDPERLGRGTKIWRFGNLGRVHQGKLFL